MGHLPGESLDDRNERERRGAFHRQRRTGQKDRRARRKRRPEAQEMGHFKGEGSTE